MTSRCGFVAVVGAPNAGKSTLINRLTGAKVSIVSPKAQTTRFRVLGILMRGDSQVLLVDTPGIFRPRRKLDRAMVKAAWTGAADADLAVLLVDAKSGAFEEVRAIAQKLGETGRRAWLVLNKTDQPPGWDWDGQPNAVRVSAATGVGLADLSAAVVRRLVPNPPAAGEAVPFTPALADLVERVAQLLAAGNPSQARAALRPARPD